MESSTKNTIIVKLPEHKRTISAKKKKKQLIHTHISLNKLKTLVIKNLQHLIHLFNEHSLENINYC